VYVVWCMYVYVWYVYVHVCVWYVWCVVVCVVCVCMHMCGICDECVCMCVVCVWCETGLLSENLLLLRHFELREGSRGGDRGQGQCG